MLCSLGWRPDLSGDSSNQFFDLNLLLPAPRMTQIRPANQKIQELHISEPTRSLQPRRSSKICHFGWVVLIKNETTGQNCLLETTLMFSRASWICQSTPSARELQKKIFVAGSPLPLSEQTWTCPTWTPDCSAASCGGRISTGTRPINFSTSTCCCQPQEWLKYDHPVRNYKSSTCLSLQEVCSLENDRKLVILGELCK